LQYSGSETLLPIHSGFTRQRKLRAARDFRGGSARRRLRSPARPRSGCSAAP